MNRTKATAGTVALFLLLAAPAWSEPRQPFSPTDQELLLLPEECRILLKGSMEQRKLIHQKFFPGLVGPNHYCWGLNFLNRARFSSMNKTEKRFNLQSAIGEFGYVLTHSPPKAYGLQQIKIQQEQAEMMLKLVK